MDLRQQLECYRPYNEQEAGDRQLMLSLLDGENDIFARENLTAHFSASSWIVNHSRDKVLMIYHNLYDSWSWTGGHADGERDLLSVAMREAEEETGVKRLRPLMEDIFSVEIITVDGHEKRGAYVPSHVHLNVTYLLEADEGEELRIKPDENSGVKWVPFEDVAGAVTEPWMTERVYNKLSAKLAEFLQGPAKGEGGAYDSAGALGLMPEKENRSVRGAAGAAGSTGNVISDGMAEYAALLANLELSDEEKEQARKDMGEMLDYIDKLNELDTEGVEPACHIFPVNNRFREDVVTNGDGSADALFNAPEKKDGGFKVPRTIG